MKAAAVQLCNHFAKLISPEFTLLSMLKNELLFLKKEDFIYRTCAHACQHVIFRIQYDAI